ncbi:hypothetical protein BRC83_09300 [Halobacteriales archaeon QS_1_68_17]|nr:MAG: hypothetical protein BRC83_09300 [Halobacteriales archaeon QS_1_68_17]
MDPLLHLSKLWRRGGDHEPGYECLDCGARFDRQQQVCRECGGYDIQRTEWVEGGHDTSQSDA